MSVVLRSIENKAWFLNGLVAKENPWLLAVDLQADAFKGVKTIQNVLSVFELEDESEEKLGRTLAALAATREHVPQLDCVVIKQELLLQLAISTEKTLGATPDGEVNQWHVNLVQLNADRLVAFCQTLRERGTFYRKSVKQVAKLLDHGLRTGRIERAQVKESLLQSIAKYV